MQIVAYGLEPVADLAEYFAIDIRRELDILRVREYPAYIWIAVGAFNAKEERRSSVFGRILIRLQVPNAVGAVLSCVS